MKAFKQGDIGSFIVCICAVSSLTLVVSVLALLWSSDLMFWIKMLRVSFATILLSLVALYILSNR